MSQDGGRADDSLGEGLILVTWVISHGCLGSQMPRPHLIPMDSADTALSSPEMVEARLSDGRLGHESCRGMDLCRSL